MRLPSGRILAAVRMMRQRLPGDPPEHLRIEPRASGVPLGYKSEFLSYSDDDGKTWSPARMVTRNMECPGSLVRLSDGTVVLTYGMKLEPWGARALVSKDEGETWHPEVLDLVHCKGQGGHASSVVLPEDTIVTRWSGGVVRWRVPDELRVRVETGQ